MNKVGAVIQARTGSTRLPNKVLMKLPYDGNITVLEQIVRRVQKCRRVNWVNIATSDLAQDDPITDLGQQINVDVFRGSEQDVLSRYYHSAIEFNLNTIVRITGDSPALDPQIIDHLIEEHFSHQADYTTTTLKRTYPVGLDAEIIEFKALEAAFRESTEPEDREHVTRFIYRNPNRFKLLNVETGKEFDLSSIRVTLDTQEDYILFCVLYDYLYSKNPCFGLNDIVEIFRQKPWLMGINQKISMTKMLKGLAS